MGESESKRQSTDQRCHDVQETQALGGSSPEDWRRAASEMGKGEGCEEERVKPRWKYQTGGMPGLASLGIFA
jgi:hypothetical protein